jgi:alpha-tubulin suppressor-like RCC1 family protein
MSRDNEPAIYKGRYLQLRKENTMLTINDHTCSEALSYSKRFFQVTRGLLLLLIAMPAVSANAATPWYAQGSAHILVLTEDGKVWGLGENNAGQLGNGRFGGESLEPKQVGALSGVIAVVAGDSHSVALKNDGTVWTWGANESGQLGDGTTQRSPVPRQVEGVSDVKAIATGRGHIVALKHDGTVLTWGGNLSGQGGKGDSNNCMTPAPVPGLQNVTAIAAGQYNTFALKNDGTVWSWGYNGSGQLGTGNNARIVRTPARVTSLDSVRAITAGNSHMVALKQDGTLWTWGSNSSGQLGNTTASYSAAPLQVAGIKNIIDITASVGHTFAIAANNTVWAWGDVGTGQLGNGFSMEGSTSPVPVVGYNGPINVAAVVNPGTLRRDQPDGSSLLAAVGSGDNPGKLIQVSLLTRPVSPLQ